VASAVGSGAAREAADPGNAPRLRLPDFGETVELIGDVDAIRPQPLVNQMGGGTRRLRR
jgi:hypothetical protein